MTNMLLPNLILIKKTLDIECNSENTFMSNMTISMKAKFDKYLSYCLVLFLVACIFDLRIKIFGINYYYP